MRELLAINSENPPGNEAKIAQFVARFLKSRGLKVRLYEFSKNRTNVLASLEGRDAQQSLLITPHLDTVPAGRGWKTDPFCAYLGKGKMYGLGATDCKGNLACALEAIASITEEKRALRYHLIFAATADEESGSGLGLVPLLEKRILKPDAALVLDADAFEIVITQKGLMHLKVSLEGKKAHGAYPWRGKNAIDVALAVLAEIKKRKTSCMPNKYLRPPTINIGTIKGGDKVNVVADWCEFELDFRFLPGSSAKVLLQELRRTLKKYAPKFKIEVEGIQNPYWIAPSHPLVSGLVQAMQRVKAKPVIKGSEGATVISFFQSHNIPAVATGFGSSGTAHMANEFVKLDNLYKGTLALENFLREFAF